MDGGVNGMFVCCFVSYIENGWLSDLVLVGVRLVCYGCDGVVCCGSCCVVCLLDCVCECVIDECGFEVVVCVVKV